MGFAFLAPWLLVAAPVFGVFAWRMYRSRGDGQEKQVSTIALLKQFKKAPLAKKDPKLPIRYFLECLAALLLTCIIAGVFRQFHQDRVLIVFDQSLSTEARTAEHTTFQDLLRQRVNDYFNGLSLSTVVDVITTTHRQIVRDTTQEKLTELITEAHKPHSDDLAELLSSLPLRTYSTIYIASDHRVDADRFDGEIINQPQASLPEKRNIYVNQGMLINSGQTAVRGTIGKTSVEIPAKGSVSLAPDVAGEFQASSWSDDRITQDNEVRAQVTKNTAITVIQSNTVQHDYRGLPKKYEILREKSSDSDNSSPQSAVIFGSSKTVDTLDVGFPLDKFLIQDNQGDVVTGALSWWKEDSVLMRYVHPELIHTISAHRIECPLWASTDLKIDGKTVLCHGQTKGKRVVLSGLQLLPFNIEHSNFTDILTLNIFEWLFHEHSAENQSLIQESNMDSEDIHIHPVDIKQVEVSGEGEAGTRKLFFLLLILFLVSDIAYTLVTKKIYGRGI